MDKKIVYETKVTRENETLKFIKYHNKILWHKVLAEFKTNLSTAKNEGFVKG